MSSCVDLGASFSERGRAPALSPRPTAPRSAGAALRTFRGKSEKKDTYQFYAPPAYTASIGTPMQHSTMFDTKVEKVNPEFKDRLYLINNQLYSPHPVGVRWVRNNPTGGALEWAFSSEIGVIDTAGDVRWYFMNQLINDPGNPLTSGFMMGFQQAADGNLVFGYGQRYAKYDMLGREIFNRRLPMGYADYSHALDAAQNGHTFLRVASSDLRRTDGKRVHTVRDVIIEVDESGSVVDEFRLFDILDPYRDNVVKALDQGAVCLNIDASKAGQTMSAEELAKMDASDAFATSPVRGRAATGHTSIPSTTTPKTTPSSSPRVISPPSSRSVATRR